MMTWTPDEIVFLRRCYGTRTNEYLAARLPYSQHEIEMMASQLSIAKDKRQFKGRKMPRWNAQEVEILRQRYPTRSNLSIARELGRSVKSILSKAQGLKLLKDEQRLREMGLANVVMRRDRTKP